MCSEPSSGGCRHLHFILCSGSVVLRAVTVPVHKGRRRLYGTCPSPLDTHAYNSFVQASIQKSIPIYKAATKREIEVIVDQENHLAPEM